MKLPLTAGVVLLGMGVILSLAAVVAVRRATLQGAQDRLSSLTEQLATNFQTAAQQLAGRVGTLASDPAIPRFLRDPVRHREAAQAGLGRVLVPQDSVVLATELRDRSGRVLLGSGKAADLIGSRSRGEWIPAPDERGDSVVVGGFRQFNDTLVAIPVVAPVPSEPGTHLVQWRRALSSPAIRGQVARLLGSEARLLLGNADGTLWTDLLSVVPAPTLPPDQVHGLLTYTRPGEEEVLASVVPIAGTPWSLALEFPTRAVMAPVNSFVRTMAGIAGLCLAVGLLLTWMLSRRLTAPLEQLTRAADAIAAGDVSRRAGLDRTDELGRLGSAFDSMAGQIEEARYRLEEKVALRTRELNSALGLLQDAQQALARREKLALLGQLASGVGHELRNPLGVMSNAVYYLDAVQPDAPEDVRKFLGILREQISLSAKIVNDLLDFSRMTPAERMPIALHHIVETQLRRVSLPPGIAVHRDLPDALPLVLVDPVHAGQIVLNLLTNALEAMGSSGTLALRGRSMGDGRVRLEISDSGPGVPPDQRDKIFEPLFTTKASGVGLGLAVSKSLAQANGGELSLLTMDGRPGASFGFDLPAAPA
jgi:signal transduction histidine kinase